MAEGKVKIAKVLITFRDGSSRQFNLFPDKGEELTAEGSDVIGVARPNSGYHAAFCMADIRSIEQQDIEVDQQHVEQMTAPLDLTHNPAIELL